MTLEEALEENLNLRDKVEELESELKLAYAHQDLAESFIPEESWEDYEEMYWK